MYKGEGLTSRSKKQKFKKLRGVRPVLWDWRACRVDKEGGCDLIVRVRSIV